MEVSRFMEWFHINIKKLQPIFKKIDMYEGVYVLDGLERGSLMRGPALGEKLAEMILADE